MKTIYELEWRNKFLTNHAESTEDMATMLADAAAFVRELHEFGDKVTVNLESSSDDYIFFYTEDPEIAEEYGFSRMSPAEISKYDHGSGD